MRKRFVLFVALFAGVSSFAELRLAAIFSDNMVLQRDQKVAVWGWARPNEKVTVCFADRQVSTNAGPDGKFLVRLEKMIACKTPRTLTVRTAGGEKKEIKNVLVGEVWLCSGQSNMHMSVKGCAHAEEEISKADYPQIRMFLTDLKASTKPLDDCTGSWKVTTPENVGEFSATAYFFGRELYKNLDVPIGLIRSSWGGTCVEAWSPMESLKKFPSVMEYKAAMDKQAKGFDQAAENRRFAQALEKWRENMKAAKTGKRKLKPREKKRPKKRTNPLMSQNYPANLYNAMIHPLVPYGIRGAIWYQGERNSKSLKQAILYRDLLANMITSWRKAWGSDFPFYAVQLPNFRRPQTEPSQDTGWVYIRESFLRFHKEVPNAGIAVTIDIGEENNIHPKNKQEVGRRLARQALVKTYGEKLVPGGPIYKSMKKKGSEIIIYFDDIGSGLVAKGGPLKTFAIAGADRKFVWADARIVGDTVVVSSAKVPDPVAVRYAWADNPLGCNLYNREGFPASPFRTDDWAPAGTE